MVVPTDATANPSSGVAMQTGAPSGQAVGAGVVAVGLGPGPPGPGEGDDDEHAANKTARAPTALARMRANIATNIITAPWKRQAVVSRVEEMTMTEP
jgi:hypothetical protein